MTVSWSGTRGIYPQTACFGSQQKVTEKNPLHASFMARGQGVPCSPKTSFSWTTLISIPVLLLGLSLFPPLQPKASAQTTQKVPIHSPGKKQKPCLKLPSESEKKFRREVIQVRRILAQAPDADKDGTTCLQERAKALLQFLESPESACLDQWWVIPKTIKAYVDWNNQDQQNYEELLPGFKDISYKPRPFINEEILFKCLDDLTGGTPGAFETYLRQRNKDQEEPQVSALP